MSEVGYHFLFYILICPANFEYQIIISNHYLILFFDLSFDRTLWFVVIDFVKSYALFNLS